MNKNELQDSLQCLPKFQRILHGNRTENNAKIHTAAQRPWIAGAILSKMSRISYIPLPELKLCYRAKLAPKLACDCTTTDVMAGCKNGELNPQRSLQTKMKVNSTVTARQTESFSTRLKRFNTVSLSMCQDETAYHQNLPGEKRKYKAAMWDNL